MSEEMSAPVSAPVESAPIEGDSPIVESRKFKVKVNGIDQEVDEAELLSGYQTRKASDEKFREAAMSRKQAEEFIGLLRTNPMKVLNDPNLGLNFRELAEKFLVEQMEEEMLDPRDRELRDAKRQLAEIEDAKRQAKKSEEDQANEELKAKFTNDYTNQIVEALASSGLPKTEHTVKRMAYYMHQGVQRGYDLTASDVASLVKEDYIQEQKSLYGSLDGDMLIQLLGADVANKIRKHDVTKFKSSKQTVTPAKQGAAPSSRPSEPVKMSKEDWKAKMNRVKSGMDE